MLYPLLASEAHAHNASAVHMNLFRIGFDAFVSNAVLALHIERYQPIVQSFFTRWWREQTTATKDLVRKLVDNGQLDFVNGGYVQHDEAAAHYVAMIDQTTRGHR